MSFDGAGDLTPQLSVLADDGCPHFREADVNEANATSLCRAIAELERAFRELCNLSFKRQMPLPVITIQSKGRKNAIGWFWEDKWQSAAPRPLPEINICPEYLDLDIEDIAEVLLHEMCHYANYLDGIRDCSSSQYHNQKFKRRCDLICLVCRKGKKGWAYTELSAELREIVGRLNLDPDVFKMYRTGPNYTLVEAKPERRLRRWTCQCKKPKVIYASRGLNVTCSSLLQNIYGESFGLRTAALILTWAASSPPTTAFDVP